MNLPDSGLIAVVKRDCQTCEMTEPVLAALADSGALTVYTQDDPAFPESVPHEFDEMLDISHKLKIEVVPTVNAGVNFHRLAGATMRRW